MGIWIRRNGKTHSHQHGFQSTSGLARDLRLGPSVGLLLVAGVGCVVTGRQDAPALMPSVGVAGPDCLGEPGCVGPLGRELEAVMGAARR